MSINFFRWLNNQGIQKKLLIFIIIPLLAILFFAISGISEKYQKYTNSKNIQHFFSIVIKLDDLVYELQKERGISTGLIEINAEKFKNNINSQREQTDKSFRDFSQLKKTVDTSFFSWTIREESFNLDKLLEQLPIIREAIDEKDFSNLIHNYSDLNEHAINFIQHLQLLTTDNELARLSDAYTNLLWLQERSGQERATLIWVFATGNMDADHFRQIISSIESQEALLKNYNIKAPSKYRHLLQKQLSRPVNDETNKFRNAAINKVIRNELLNELQSLIGYGGLIHNFKNYLIQGELTYFKEFQKINKDIEHLIKRYKASPGITQQDLYHLTIIEETLADYIRSIDQINSLLEQGVATQNIDKQVTIDDTLALQAIAYLRKGLTGMDAAVWWKISTERIDLIKETNDQLKTDISKLVANNTKAAAYSLLLYLFITLVTLLVSLVIGIFLMKRLIGELTNISNSMRKMFQEKRFDEPLRVDGKDEIGTMAKTFNQLISEQLKFESELKLSAEVFANAKEAIMIADANKRIQMVNPAFQEVSGFNEKYIQGKDFLCLNERLMDNESSELFWSKLQQNSHLENELWYIKPNGVKYLVRLSTGVVKDRKGVINNYIGIFTDITERKRYEKQIWRQANYDALTNLPNRNMCMDRLSQNLKIAKREQTQTAVLFIDLDRFKLINDTLGHSVGDELLKEVAFRLKNTIRESDIVSRLGGDEFIIILKGIKQISTIERICKGILAAISRPVPLNDSSETFTSGSIGIAVFPHDGKDVETLMKHADTAMYQSKKTGSNNFMFYKQEMNAAVMRHMEIEKELRKGITDQQFRLHYQSVIELSTGRVSGAEALIRWQHPEYGLIGPEKFIQIAEDSDLIVPIGEWVITMAAQQAIEWNRLSTQLLKIAVNISSRQFINNGQTILETLTKMFEDKRLKPGMLEIEITESLLMNGALKTIDSLQQIRDLGIGISLDDFGTGYSSLSYLKNFPISTIKIDRSFIQDATKNKKDAQLVQAIVMLSAGLELDVIAEGIEEEEQLEFLKKLGCKSGQGYYFSRPLPKDDFDSYLCQQGIITTLDQLPIAI